MIRRPMKWTAIIAFLSGLLDGVAPSPRTTMKADADDVDRKLKTANAELDRTRTDLESSRKTEKAARDAAEDAGRKLARLTGRVIHQAGRIADRMGINATRNVASMAAEAMPLIGTATIVGVTTLEVIDACWTIEDVFGLVREAGGDGAAIRVSETLFGYVTDGPDAVMAALWSSFSAPNAPRESCEQVRAAGVMLANDCTALPTRPALPVDVRPPVVVAPPLPERPEGPLAPAVVPLPALPWRP